MRWKVLAVGVGLCLATSTARADVVWGQERTYKATLQTPSGARSPEVVAVFSPDAIYLNGYDPARKQWVTLLAPLFDELTVENGTFTFVFPGPPGAPPVTLKLTQAQMNVTVRLRDPGACGPKVSLRLSQKKRAHVSCPSLMDYEENDEGYKKYQQAVRKQPRCWFLREPAPKDTCALFHMQRYYDAPHRSDTPQPLESYLGYALPLNDMATRLRYCNKADDGRCLDVRPLVEALQSGHPELVPVLLEEGADPQSAGALLAAIEGKHEEALKALLAAGATVQEHDLELATASGDPRWMEHFLKAGARPRTDDLLGAVEQGHEGLARKMIDAGVPIPSSLMAKAASQGMEGLVRVLLARKVRVDAPGPDGMLPLIAAFPHSNIMRLLLAAGADVHAKSAGGMTALHLAAHQGDAALVRELLKAGADLHARETRCQHRAVDVARANNHEDVVRILEAAGSTHPVNDCQAPAARDGG
jgi:ankyrin repeat protein